MKRIVYLTLTVLLGLLLSGIAHAVMEIIYLGWALKNNRPVHWQYYADGRFPCALPPALFYGLPVIGSISGLLMGRVWWRWVYEEGRHWRHRRSR